MNLRLIGFGGVAFVVVTASLLSTIVLRDPQTHDHIAASLRAGYDRTPLDSVGATNLPAILVDLPDFSFPAPPVVAAAPTGESNSEATHIADEEQSDGEEGIPTEEPQVQKITLRQFEFGFGPERIELAVGVPVELTVMNEGDQVHGIWIPDFAISEDIRSGKTKVFTFTPEEAARFRFTCSYNLCGTDEEHAQMKGFITVK
ncbi:MAG: cupredoxin domain-containing protein [Dehalococcoidia bacterium]